MAFAASYSDLFATFGYPLSGRTATSTKVIEAAEKRLGVHVPAALREFYLVAGRERRFNRALNPLKSPTEWFVDKRRLAFMDENQAVCFWGVSIGNETANDPPVAQGIDDESISWHREHAKCSVFLAVMLHYQAVSGGFSFCASADAPDTALKLLKKGWRYAGEINKQQAFNRPNQAVFLTSLFGNAMVMAGAKSKRDLASIGQDLGVSLS